MELGLFSLEERPRYNLLVFINKKEIIFVGNIGKHRERINFKLKGGTFSLDVTGKFFTDTIVRPWHRLPREAMDAPFLEAFKVRLHVLWNLI